MHAARAIHKQREKREEKTKHELRRPSGASYTSRLPRSPAVSVDTSAKKSGTPVEEPTDHLNLSYVGFIIAVFGAVPLLVGTFVEVPALWEIGLGVTLVGLFIGVVFWCKELCAEAKRFSQKKNQLSSRGKIEDSNLLHVPDRKFGNGLDSRRGSFQSDSVSLISPAVQHYTPKHNPNLPQLGYDHPLRRNSMSQYSSDYSTTSGRINGHLVPPALILRGNGRRDDGRVVSLVQPDPGLDDDSDSDAETVIEAPLSHSHNTKIIQVQSCQEKQHHLNRLPLSTTTTFSIENEKVSPLAPHHRTIRMPVMPQEIDKLQRCECGRYLLTERDKLIGIKLPGITGTSSGSTTTSNSPTSMGSLPLPGNGSAPPPPKKAPHGNFSMNLDDSTDNNAAMSTDVTTPLADQPPPPPPNKIISVNPSVKIAPTIPPTPRNIGHATNKGSSTSAEENIVQVDPTLSSSTASDLLTVASSVAAKPKTENLDDEFDDDDDEGDMTPGNESNKPFRETVTIVVEEKDKILTELLELVDINDEEVGKTNEAVQQKQAIGELTVPTIASNDENHNASEQAGEQSKQQFSTEGSRRKLQYQSQLTSINRPTSLPLPVSISDSFMMTEVTNSSNNNDDAEQFTQQGTEQPQEMQASSIAQSTFIAEKESDDSQQGQPIQVQPGNEMSENKPNLPEDMSLDELLDSIEKNQDGEVLAVVVQ